MRLRTSAPAVLIVTVVLVLVITGFASNRMSTTLISSVEESRFELMRSILVNNLADAENKALARAELVASMPNIQHLMRSGDREAMADELRTAFAGQRDRFGVDQAQFIAPGTTSFLRLNAEEKFGDDLATFRPMIVEWAKSHESLKGLSVSRSGPAVFGLTTVVDEQGDIGGLEFGLDFAAVLDGLKSRYGLEAALYIDEKQLRDIATGMSGDIITDENRLGKYMRVHTTHVDRMKELVSDRDVSGGERKYVRDAAGVPFGVVVVPAKNFAGKPIGMIAVASDFAGSRGAASETIVWQLLLGLLGVVICAGAILVVVRGMMLRPLREVSEKLAAIAAGDGPGMGDATIEGADEMCEELQSIAASVETLRKKHEDLGRAGGAE
jgi:methyl-accepting chemotaxis protein